VGPKDGRPPRYHPDRDYIKEFAEGENVGDGVGKPVKRRHDDEWLNGFLKDVAGEIRDRR